ncbi:hypothetical protein EGW08_018439 [Elysia chlorotica]|uniref:Uncharacterized protein n=1 Tax=Elysia chlorotica TaxID=188477 RepID=A0A3S1BSD0_ELYCH|nr:hypothetical protein EGW08_018439 [Elysia chlorotica]
MAAQPDLEAAGEFDPDDASGRESMYSPASSYSTYSREVKYIFEPQCTEEESQDEYPDYSHIGPRTAVTKQQNSQHHHHHHQQQSHNGNSNSNNHFISHTPRTLSAVSSHFSDGGGAGNKENRTPNGQFHHHGRLGNHIHELPVTDEDSIFEESPSPSGSQAFQYNFYKHHYNNSYVDSTSGDPYHENQLCSPRGRSSFDRGPISPGMEEALYSSTSTFSGCKPNNFRSSPRKNSTMSDHSYFSAAAAAAASRGGVSLTDCRSPPNRNSYGNPAVPHHRGHLFVVSPYGNQQQQQNYTTYSKQAHPAPHRSSFNSNAGYYNTGNRAGAYSQQQRTDKPAPSAASRDRLSGADTRHERVFPLQNSHQSSHQQHYPQQVPHHPQPHSVDESNSHYQQSRLLHPPYPQPPRYDYQAHRRRKTWSPQIVKMGPLAASSSALADSTLVSEGSTSYNISNGGGSDHRPFYSNDSLLDYLAAEDGSRARVEQRKAQSLSEDLDVTPPRLAPISGVLAQVSGLSLSVTVVLFQTIVFCLSLVIV